MSEEKYYAVFPYNEELASWLKEKLRLPHQLEVSENAIVVVSPTKDDSHKVAVWIYHNNPVDKLKYSIRGVKDGRLIYVSRGKKK